MSGHRDPESDHLISGLIDRAIRPEAAEKVLRGACELPGANCREAVRVMRIYRGDEKLDDRLSV